MKIALICDSLLLDRSLEMYLKEYLTSYKLCDFVVATQFVESQKPVFLIGNFEGADLKIPFTRDLLLQELEAFDRKVRGRAMQESKNEESRIYLEPLEEDNIKRANVASASFDIPKTIESSALQDNKFNSNNSMLKSKIEEVLHRYAQEIESIVLEHYKDKNV